MSRLTLSFTIGFLGMVLIAIYFAFKMGEPSPIFASGVVELDPSTDADASHFRTIFITVFDADSPMPMPYGASRFQLSAPISAAGKILDFTLTKESVQVMNEQLPVPKRLRIKARLDADGLGGVDQSGDWVGEKTDVTLGSSQVVISINRKI